MTTANLQNYHTLQSVDEMISESQNQSILVFKHSSVCPTSFYAKNQVDEFLHKGSVKVYLLIVQNQRPLSNEIAATLGVKHQSPQLIVIRNGKSEAVLNHHEITLATVQEFI